MKTFELSPGEIAKISEWSAEQDAIFVSQCREKGETVEYPLYGAIGGELTYMFTPMGLGIVTKVEHGGTHAVLDVTEYEDW